MPCIVVHALLLLCLKPFNACAFRWTRVHFFYPHQGLTEHTSQNQLDFSEQTNRIWIKPVWCHWTLSSLQTVLMQYSLPPAPIPPSASKPLSPLPASPSSPSSLSIGDAPLFAGCQLDNNCHSRGAGIYVRFVVWKKRQTHPSFSPSFPESSAARPRVVSLYRELLSQWHSHTVHTPRWKRVALCVIQRAPRFVLALTRGACHPARTSRRGETSTAVSRTRSTHSTWLDSFVASFRSQAKSRSKLR